MKIVALIPARLGSTRLPKKLIQDLGGKTVIQRTYESTLNTNLFDEVWVVTDSDLIETQIKELGGKVFRSRKEHESGSDRIAEAAEEIDAGIVVNVQGDEPFQDQKTLQDLISAFQQKEVQVATLKTIIPEEQVDNPNFVKVVDSKEGDALYFSRSVIPFNRDKDKEATYWRHIGVYAYRREVLLAFTKMDKSELEQLEMLEQLRLLENGIKIKMVATTHHNVAIDTAEDLIQAKRIVEQGL